MLSLNDLSDLTPTLSRADELLRQSLEKYTPPDPHRELLNKINREQQRYLEIVDPYHAYREMLGLGGASAFHRMQQQAMKDALAQYSQFDEFEKMREMATGYSKHSLAEINPLAAQLKALGSTVADSYTDVLDGAISRRLFTTQIDEAVKRASQFEEGHLATGLFAKTVAELAEQKRVQEDYLTAGAFAKTVAEIAEKQRRELDAIYRVASDPLQDVIKKTIAQALTWPDQLARDAYETHASAWRGDIFSGHRASDWSPVYAPSPRPNRKTVSRGGPAKNAKGKASPVAASPFPAVDALYEAIQTLCPRVEEALRDALHAVLSRPTALGADWITNAAVFSNWQLGRLQAYAQNWSKKGANVQLYQCLDLGDILCLLKDKQLWLHVSFLFTATQDLVIEKIEQVKSTRDQGAHKIPGLTEEAVDQVFENAEEIAHDLNDKALADTVKRKRDSVVTARPPTLH